MGDMGDVAKLQRDALFKKLRAKPENKVCRDESSQGPCVLHCRSVHSRPAHLFRVLAVALALCPYRCTVLSLMNSDVAS